MKTIYALVSTDCTQNMDCTFFDTFEEAKKELKKEYKDMKHDIKQRGNSFLEDDEALLEDDYEIEWCKWTIFEKVIND